MYSKAGELTTQVKHYLFNWNYKIYSGYLGRIAAFCAVFPIFFHIMLVSFTDSTDIFWLRLLCSAMLLSALFLPKNETIWRPEHKIYYELLMFINMPITFYWHYLINASEPIWIASLIYGSFIYGLFSQNIIGMLATTLVSMVAIIYARYYEIKSFEEMFIMSCLAISSYVIAALLQISFRIAIEAYLNIKSRKTRLESLGAMAGGICHEANSPLTVIDHSLYLLNKKISQSNLSTENLISGLHTIEKSSRKVSLILRNLNYFSEGKFSGYNSNEVPIDIFIQEAIDKFARILKDENIKFSVNDKDNISRYIQVPQDCGMDLVFANIIQNAIDSFEPTQPFKMIEFKIQRMKNYLKIQITNSGPEIPESYVDKIFEPFFTTKEVGEGMGLGLSVAFGILKNRGGDLYLSQEKSQVSFIIKYHLS